jgi:hypothetical protein
LLFSSVLSAMSVARSSRGLSVDACGFCSAGFFLYRPAIGDVSRRANVAIGDAPDFATFIHVDDPDQIIISMARVNEIGNTLTRWPDPSRAAHDDAHKRGIKLKHAQESTNGVPETAAFDAHFIVAHELLPNSWTSHNVPI